MILNDRERQSDIILTEHNRIRSNVFLQDFHSIHVEFHFLGLTFILHSARGYILERNERRRNLLLEYSICPREELYLLQRGQRWTTRLVKNTFVSSTMSFESVTTFLKRLFFSGYQSIVCRESYIKNWLATSLFDLLTVLRIENIFR